METWETDIFLITTRIVNKQKGILNLNQIMVIKLK